MEHTRRDFFVGLFILLMLGVVIGAFLATSDALKREIDVYLEAPSARGLSQDTRVQLQGLEIGRVTAVFPIRAGDSLSFVARLTLDESFPDGSDINLRVGTTAIIEQPLPITAPFINLVPSPLFTARLLQPGDTIASSRAPGTIDQIVEVLLDLKDELGATLVETRDLMTSGSALLATASESITGTTPRLQESLEGITASLARAESMIADLSPRIGPIADSLTTTVASAHSVMQRLDSVAVGAEALMTSVESPLQSALASIAQAARIVEHIADQVRQRPTRILTGIGPLPPPDTTERPR